MHRVTAVSDRPQARRKTAQAPVGIFALSPGGRARRFVEKHLWAAAAMGLGVCLIWSHWPTLAELCAFWGRNDDYSAGALVPPVALYFAWQKRAFLRSQPVQPSFWGATLLAAVQGVRLGAIYYGFGSIERLAIVLSVAAVVLLAAGRYMFWHLRWVLVFLLLMLPLPGRVHETVALPLQKLATSLAAFLLELCGFFVVREGHVLRLDANTTIGVSEACSGLRMLTAFVFVSAVLAFLIRRPMWQKTLVVASSIPIAVLANGLRGAATAAFVYYARDPSLSERFHDLAGLAMMPLAIVFTLALLRFFALIDPTAATAKLGPRCPPSR